MLTKIDLLRNVGQFDSVAPGVALPFNTTSLIYAENGRGKTTLASILRSLSVGDPELITERHRLGAQHAPHVIITANGQQYIFQNNAWSASLPDIAIFDDCFVSENVCSGIDVVTEHRQNLHELILGSQGVALNTALQLQVSRVEEHNRNLREREAAIPASLRGDFSIDAFCGLARSSNIEAVVLETGRHLDAARSAEIVRRQANFVQIRLPSFDTEGINDILQRDLSGLQAEAAARVQRHLLKLGNGAEAWISEGVQRLAATSADNQMICPFCTLSLEESAIISYYENYFSTGYASVKQAIIDKIQGVTAAHGQEIPAAFERSIRIAAENAAFWRRFIEVPAFEIDTASIALSWKIARELVLSTLRSKFASPLERMSLTPETITAIANYNQRIVQIEEISQVLQGCNSQIALTKERVEGANIATLTSDLNRQKAIQRRYTTDVDDLCQAYLNERAVKRITEENRQNARTALDQYRSNIFAQYETAINTYLAKFNVGFRLSSITSVNNRGGSSCTYNVLINNVPVSITSQSGPSFKNTLSAGDRNTLALAFFFASLDQDPRLSDKIVVIDDPMTSLDEHRSLATIHEIRDLLSRVKQVVVLSHSKAFLCQIWESADRTDISAFKMARSGQSSLISIWDVRLDSITEHDKRHALVKEYINAADSSKEREVAAALRHMLEAFLRVAYPIEFPPGTILGNFHNRCDQALSSGISILNTADTVELRRLMDYANRFHHETNLAYATELINDQELLEYCRRTIKFTQKPNVL